MASCGDVLKLNLSGLRHTSASRWFHDVSSFLKLEGGAQALAAFSGAFVKKVSMQNDVLQDSTPSGFCVPRLRDAISRRHSVANCSPCFGAGPSKVTPCFGSLRIVVV